LAGQRDLVQQPVAIDLPEISRDRICFQRWKQERQFVEEGSRKQLIGR
jgi:hypothetical protein